MFMDHRLYRVLKKIDLIYFRDIFEIRSVVVIIILKILNWKHH